MKRRDIKVKRLLTVLLLFVIFYCIILVVKSQIQSNYVSMDREGLLAHVSHLINSGTDKIPTEGQACRVPFLEVQAPEIMALLNDAPPVQCGKSSDWVVVKGSVAKIGPWVRKIYGDVECSFTDIIRESDFKQHQGITTTTHTEYNLEASDVVTARCVSEKGQIWTKTLTGVRTDQEIFDRTGWSKVPSDGLHLNVAMFGFDSVSHNMWKRKLPKTYAYATKQLSGIALNGYNIVGDGTPQALIPILTGKTELELPDTRKRMGSKAQYVNVYPFIWNEFAKNGYATGWTEDLANVGTFTYRLKGFQEQPVDHYMRTFYMEAMPDYRRFEPYCYGSLTRIQILMSLMRNMYNVYTDRPKFIFSFHSEYSHDSSDSLGNADEDLLSLLQEFNAKGYLNNTMLILMSDHGSRFAAMRNTQQGKQEERLPGFIFILPPWFKKKYPSAYKNFIVNANRLTTPFDIYATLSDVLHFGGSGKGDVNERSISLFKEIPRSRTCRDASIEPHWCTCLDWEEIPPTDSIATKAFNFFVAFINSATSENRKLCAELKLSKAVWAARLRPNKNLLAFTKNADLDGFIGDMSGKTKITNEVYQIKLILKPGEMIFEASLSYQKTNDKFSIKASDISRIDKYSRMTHCIEDFDILHQLRKYCNCVS